MRRMVKLEFSNEFQTHPLHFTSNNVLGKWPLYLTSVEKDINQKTKRKETDKVDHIMMPYDA